MRRLADGRWGASWAAAALVAVGFADAAWAQDAAPACPSGNLLAGKVPRTVGVRAVERSHDDISAPEGAFWNVPLAAVLENDTAQITWDLGAPTRLGAAWVQADANDYYTVWGSPDGVSFTEIGRVDPAEGDGLRGRRVLFPAGTVVRFFRFGGGQGDGYFSLSELQLFCEPPAPFPPRLRVDAAPMAKSQQSRWNDTTASRWQLILAVLGLLLLLWRPGGLLEGDGPATVENPRQSRLDRAWLRLRRVLGRLGALVTFVGRPPQLEPGASPEARAHVLHKVKDRLLMVLGLLAGLTYINFFTFHFGNFFHDWEWTHYYVGAKYFDELSYDRLYECMSVADVEAGLGKRVERRRITDLKTNLLVSTADIIAHPERCKRHFTPARWQEFTGDVAFFRKRQDAKRWDDLYTDHGFNATPVWNIVGRTLANLGATSNNKLWTLGMLDHAYLLATYGVIWWAFGWRALCVSLLVFATNFPSRFTWTGGSFLRWDWLFYTVAAVACLRKNRPWLGGAALAYATLLRVFPGFVFIGPLLALGHHIYRHRRVEPRYLRFFAGAALATTLLVPISFAVSGGVEGYQHFVRNTLKHKETPLTNYMGLRTVLAFRPMESGRYLKDDRLTDPWQKWKDARVVAWKKALPFYIVLAGGFAFLIWRAARHVQPWVAAALGITFIPIGVELTCYYYAFIIGLGVLWTEREEVGRWLLFLTGFTQFAAWAPVPRMVTWIDEQYTYMAFATLAVFTAIVWCFRDPTLAGPVLVGPTKVRHNTGARAATAPGLATQGPPENDAQSARSVATARPKPVS